MVPNERGTLWSIEDCYYGNEEKEREPIAEFKRTVDQYPRLLETMLSLSDIVSARGIHPCFTGETLVTTSEGLKEIKDVKVGDLVLTHQNRFMPVGELYKNKSTDLYELKTASAITTKVTGNHPMYVRESKITPYKKEDGSWSSKRFFDKPKWKPVEELNSNDYIGIAINQNSIIPSGKLPFESPDFWWLMGRYVGDGWTETCERKKTNQKGEDYVWTEERLIICCSKVVESHKEDIIKRLEAVGFDYRVSEHRTTYKIFIKNKDMYHYANQFGKYAHGKFIYKDVIDLPIHLGDSFLTGYFSADGYYNKEREVQNFKTVSKKLAVGLMALIHKVYKRHCSVSVLKPKVEVIEGRTVYSKEKWDVKFPKVKKSREQSFYENGFIWTKVKKVNKMETAEETTYNLGVYDDNSYVVNNLIAHNCGVLCINKDIANWNSVMKAPNGDITTQYSLSDSEATGLIKYDLLSTKAESIIQVAIELLIEYGKIEWQGSLRATYEKYFHPDVMDATDQKAWAILNRGELINAFQFDGAVGEQAVAMIQPTSILEASQANTVMRLSTDSEEQPLQKYARYKHNIQEWYQDMRNYGLTEEEIKILEPYLLHDSGVCGNQESLMSLTLAPEISNFTVPEANYIRKIIAKPWRVMWRHMI